jgi:hypothetical protein
MKFSTLMFWTIAAPMTTMALLTDARLVPLAISSLATLATMVIALVLLVRRQTAGVSESRLVASPLDGGRRS